MSLLSVDGIRKRFGPTVALDGVSFALDAGQVHALIGENGAGKSTLMNILAGALQPDSGRMRDRRRAIRAGLAARREPRGVALIHQELSLCPHLTVAENILLGREPSRWGLFQRTEAETLALDVLGSFSHPELRPEPPGRRAADGGAAGGRDLPRVASRARIVLMDEPTSSLQRDDVSTCSR